MPRSKGCELAFPETFDLQDLVHLVTGALEAAADDPQYRAGISRAVPGAPKTYGVRVPDLRDLAISIGKHYKGQTDDLIRLSKALWSRASREHRLTALFLLSDQKKLPPEVRWDLGVKFLPDVEDWETCDQLCHALLGSALAVDPVFMDELETWTTSEDFWMRRAAIVSTVLLRRAKYDQGLAEALDRRALAMCARLLNDEEHYIRKAVDWTVREVIKRHEDLAYGWMLNQSKVGVSSIGRSTLKLAAKKLPEDKREQFLATLKV